MPPVQRDSGIIEGIVKWFVIIFGLETLTTQVCVATGATFASYYWLAVATFIAGCVAAWRLRTRPVGALGFSPFVPADGKGIRGRVVTAVGFLALIAMYRLSGSYPLFWWGALFLLAAAFALRVYPDEGGRGGGAQAPVNSRGAVRIVVFTAVLAAFVTAVAHRPDADDAFYVSVPAYTLSHEQEPMLAVDTMHDDPTATLPFLIPVYSYDSIELLVAVGAKLTGLAPIAVAHEVFPPLFAVLVVLAWSLLTGKFLDGRLAIGAVVSFALLLLLGEHHVSIGNFGFVRLHQGKAVLVAAMVPLAYFYVYRFMQTGLWIDLFLLQLAVVSGVGTSSTGIFVIPLVVLIGSLSATRWGGWKRAVASWGTVLYVVLVALSVHAKIANDGSIFAFAAETTEAAIKNVFGTHTQYFLLFGITSAWLFVRTSVASSTLYLIGVLSLLGPMNPYLAGLLAHYVTSPPVYWRILWPVPVVLMVAVIFSSVLQWGWVRQKSWHPAVAGMAILFFVGFAAHYNVLRAGNHAALDWPRLKVVPADYDLALRVIKITPPGTSVLAPEPIAIWIAAQPTHPPLPVVRPLYFEFLGRYLASDDLALRMSVSHVLEGSSPSGVDQRAALAAALERYSVGLVIMHRNEDAPLAALLTKRAFVRSIIDGYAVWIHRGSRPVSE